MSVSLPLPSSPHWVPTTTVPGTRVSSAAFTTVRSAYRRGSRPPRGELPPEPRLDRAGGRGEVLEGRRSKVGRERQGARLCAVEAVEPVEKSLRQDLPRPVGEHRIPEPL